MPHYNLTSNKSHQPCGWFFALLWTLFFSIMCSPVNAGKLYKWVDDKGKVHYSDQPPETDQKVEELDLQSKTVKTTEQSQTITAQQRVKNAQKWHDSRQNAQQLKENERQKRLEEKAQQKQNQQEMIRECARLQGEITSSEAARAIIDYDANGKEFALTDEQREAYINEMKQTQQKYCSNP